MKIVKVNDYEIDIIEESENYIDIYTFEEICHNDWAYVKYGNWKYIDEGKGWRLSKLIRTNKVTNQSFEVTCESDSNSYNNYLDANVVFTYNGVRYHRFLNINRENNIDYVAQDAITSSEEHDMSKEFISYMEQYKIKERKYYDLLFPVVFALASKLNVQLFIATHSIEAIDAVLRYGNYENNDGENDPIKVITLKKMNENNGSNIVARNVTGKYVYENRKVFEFEVRL